MEIKVSTENGRVPVTIVHVDGNIDSSTSDVFLKKVNDLIEGGARHILIDFAHTPFISSAGLRALHDIFNKLRSLHPDENLSNEDVKKGITNGSYRSPHLKLLNLSKNSEATFKISGFDMYIETYTDMKTAVASF